MVSAHFFHLLIFRDKIKCEFLLHAGDGEDVDEPINPERVIRSNAIQMRTRRRAAETYRRVATVLV